MSSKLPKIIDPIITENPIVNENMNENMNENIKMDIKDHDVLVEENTTQVEDRPKIAQDVIFNDPPQVKPVVKKKRVMSEKQLENLKKAREKSNELRKQRKAEKDAEVNEILSLKKDEYLKSKVEKAVKKQENNIDKEQVIVNHSVVSKDDIQDIVSKSILQYDTQRRTEKAEKRKKKVVEEEKSRINNTIRRAQGLPKALVPTDAGYFNNCFG
tara:strand:+ start:563 stop:1204 length:642 start_codon:yes stop_codon:yes gene_type:complete